MTKTTKSKTNNYWGYIIFAALILIYIPFADSIWGASTNSTARTNNRPNKQIQTQNQNQQQSTTTNNTSTTANYCSLSSLETYNYLIDTRSFTLNGNGTVRFTKRFDHSSDTWIEDKMIITSGNYRLEGNWQVKRGNLITIKNYRIISGNFDASNNSPSRGMLKIECNGILKGVLHDRNGNAIDIYIKK